MYRKVKTLPISAVVPGSLNSIIDAWIEISGNRVTEVAIGQPFDIIVKFQAENVGAHTWHLTITAKGEGVANYRDKSIGIDNPFVVNSYVQETWVLNKKGNNIMPPGTGLLNLRFRIWAHDSMLVSPDRPPESSW